MKHACRVKFTTPDGQDGFIQQHVHRGSTDVSRHLSYKAGIACLLVFLVKASYSRRDLHRSVAGLHIFDTNCTLSIVTTRGRACWLCAAAGYRRTKIVSINQGVLQPPDKANTVTECALQDTECGALRGRWTEYFRLERRPPMDVILLPM